MKALTEGLVIQNLVDLVRAPLGRLLCREAKGLDEAIDHVLLGVERDVWLLIGHVVEKHVGIDCWIHLHALDERHCSHVAEADEDSALSSSALTRSWRRL